MKAIIFGASGQDGFYLSALLREKGIESIGVSRHGQSGKVDVSRFDEVERLIRDIQPDYVFHLAACSSTRHDVLFENHQTISSGALNVLESVRRHSPGARVFLAGSAVQFRNDGEIIDEATPFQASSPYAVARIQSVYAARYYRSLGIRAYVGYLFHHESPRRPPGHVSSMIADAARRIADGSDEILEIGDVSVEKEWTFAGDTVRAILTLVDQENVFETVIGSGEGHTIEAWLERCFGLIKRPWRDHVRLAVRFRPEYRRLVSRPALIHSLGWSPSVGLDELAALMVGTTP